MKRKIYRGHIIESISLKSVREYPDGGLCVDTDGKILFCGNFHQAAIHYSDAYIIDTNKYIIPGMVDLHTHFVQYPAIGSGKGELLPWLENYIYPLENRFADSEFARKTAREFFRDALRAGTTTIVAFGSIHKNAADIAFAEAERSGIRAFIGKCMMDRPVKGMETHPAGRNIEESLELARKWHGISPRLNYILSPRFAAACSMELLMLTAEAARKHGLLVQTHLSENPRELELISRLFPDCASYTEVYQKAGIVNRNTLFAHCIHLSDKEIDIMRQSGAGVVHCPASNRFLGSGIMPARKLMDRGLRIGMGTDIAAGFNISIIKEAQEAIENSKTYNLFENTRDIETLSPREVFHMATLGGAEALKISGNTGNFSEGKHADFLLIDKPGGVFEQSIKNIDDRIAQILYLREKHNVDATYVSGRKIYGDDYSS